MAEEVSATVQRLRGLNSDDMDKALAQAMDKRAEEIKRVAWAEKRNALLNTRARARTTDYIMTHWGDDPGVGLVAFTAGVASTRQGSRDSIGVAQQTLANRYNYGLVTEIEQLGLLKEYRSGVYDEDIFEVIFARAAKDAAREQELPKPARQIADVIQRYHQKTRLDANESGALIGELPEYVTRQMHDPHKVRKMGEAEFLRSYEERIDWERSFPDVISAADRREILKNMYSDIASGVHLTMRKDGPETNLKGMANIGKRMSHDRVIHFKDAKAAYQHMQDFSRGNLSAQLVNQFENMARNTALMRKLGPNAEMNFDRIVDDIRKSLREADPKKRERFEKTADSVRRTILPNLTGESNRPGHHGFARWSMIMRQVKQMATLGASVLSMASEPVVYASEVAYQGGGFFNGLSESIGGLATGGRTAGRNRVLAALGVMADGMKGSPFQRYDMTDNVGGTMDAATNIFFKLNLMQPVTDRMKDTFAMSRAHDFWRQKDVAFNDLSPELRRSMELFNIDETRWDLFRKQEGMSDGERTFFTPEGIDDTSDEAVAAYLKSHGRRSSPQAVREARETIKSEFRSFFADRTDHAVVTPGVRERAFMHRGHQPGTPEGEISRHFWMFKGFPTSVLFKPVARELYGRGNLKGQGAAFNDSPMMNLANLFVWTTAAGYISMNAKEMLKGRKPRVPTTLAETRDVFFASATQGGGMGLYGDFLFGEVRNRFGGGFISSAMGPTAGTISSVADVYGRMRDGDDAAAAAFRTALNNTPGANLPYTRIALDYLILHRVQEWSDPGSIRRMEDRMSREMGNEYFLRASDHIPRGGF